MFIENGGQSLLFSMMKDRLGKREGKREREKGKEGEREKAFLSTH